jgi:hypothetical protein
MNQTMRKSLFGPILLISIGVVFLVHNLTEFDLARILWRYWPLILIVLGLTKLMEYYRTSQQVPPRE